MEQPPKKKWTNSKLHPSQSRDLPYGKILRGLVKQRLYVARINGLKLDPCKGSFLSTEVLERREVEFLSLRLTLDEHQHLRFAPHPARVLYKLCHAYAVGDFPEHRFEEKCLGIRDAAQGCPVLGPLVNQVLKEFKPKRAHYDHYSMLRPGGEVWKSTSAQVGAWLSALGIVASEYESYLNSLPRMVGTKRFSHRVLDTVFKHYGLADDV